jgi:hypothetical protein
MLRLLKLWLKGHKMRRKVWALALVPTLLAACGIEPSLTAAQAGVTGRPAQAVATLASKQASRWATEAFLVAAEGFNLDQAGRLRNQPYSRWDFTYMAVNRTSTLVVTVPGRGKVTSTFTAPMFTALQPLYAGANWKVDSDKAAATARKALGSTAPDDHIDRIILSLSRPDGRQMRPVWQVVPDSAQRSVFIDAASGSVVN